MSNEEMRELDAWIIRHVMFWNCDSGVYCECDYETGITMDCIVWHGQFHPTADPAAAMEVLEKCAKKAVEIDSTSFVSIGAYRNIFQVILIYHNGETTKCSHESESETLPLAICLFAKALFGKEKV